MPIEVELSDGTIAEFPDGTPPEVMKTALQKHAAKGQSSTAAGVGKSFASGVRGGAESGVGLVGDLTEMGRAGVGKVGQWLGVSPEWTAAAQQIVGLPATAMGVTAPTTEDVAAATDTAVSKLPEGVASTVQDVTRHEPRGRAERFAQTAGGFATEALLPGGPMQRAARVLVPAAATEIAGEAAGALDPRLEGPARMIAGILASAGAAKAIDSYRTRAALRQINTSPAAVKHVEKLLIDQGMSPADAAARMDELGVGATIADTGPNTRQAAQRIHAEGGEGRGLINEQLKTREAGANARMEGEVTAAIGPQQQRSAVQEALQQRKEALGPEYKAAHAAQTQPVQTQSIVDNIESDLGTVKSQSLRAKMKQVRDSLHIMDKEGVAEPNLDPSSEGLHNARKAIDGMLYDQSGKPRDIGADEARVLKGYRKQIDDALETSTPIKDVDVKRHQIGKEERALAQGEELFETRRGVASPQEFQTTFDAMTPGEKDHLLSGVNLETWRQLGVVGNDRVKLQQILRGEGKWNYDKLATVIGEGKAQQLMNALEREKVFKDTYNKVIEGSKTAETIPAANSLRGDLADVITAGATGGPGAAAAVGAGKIGRGALAKMLTSSRTDPDIARLLMSEDPADFLRATQLLKQRGTALPAAAIGAIGAQQY